MQAWGLDHYCSGPTHVCRCPTPSSPAAVNWLFRPVLPSPNAACAPACTSLHYTRKVQGVCIHICVLPRILPAPFLASFPCRWLWLVLRGGVRVRERARAEAAAGGLHRQAHVTRMCTLGFRPVSCKLHLPQTCTDGAAPGKRAVGVHASVAGRVEQRARLCTRKLAVAWADGHAYYAARARCFCMGLVMGCQGRMWRFRTYACS